jgi:alpha-galactosidase
MYVCVCAAFHENFNQSTIREMVDALVDKSRTVSSEPTSLVDLGFDMIGIDEGWEGCGLGVDGTQHYANGTPAVRADFPDLKALVAYGHSKGVKMGFYLNGCACGEHVEKRINYEGDVNLTFALGFDGVKIDSCGAQKNMTL